MISKRSLLAPAARLLLAGAAIALTFDPLLNPRGISTARGDDKALGASATTAPQVPAATPSPSPFDPDKLADAGPYRVTSLEQDWTDATRSRTLPVRIYLPDKAPGARPVIVFSHGLGGNRNGGEMWGRHWASHGYISVHLQHPGSDESIWKGDGEFDKATLLELRQAQSNYRSSGASANGGGGSRLMERLKEAREKRQSGGAETSNAPASDTTAAAVEGRLSAKGQALVQKFKAAITPANAQLRAQDAKFALDQLAELNKTAGSPFHMRVDLSRAGISGHSFGGNTTLMAAGVQLNPLQKGAPLADPRYKAAIAMSAPPGRSYGDLTKVYGPITIPMMLMTGTEDKSFITGQDNPADRRRPYDNMAAGTHKMLVTLTGGDHGIFNGKRLFSRPGDPELQRIIRASTLAFWNANLLGDTAALAWLEKGGLATYVGKDAAVEVK
ncbi:hypothetical protein DB346_14065 [Verrucomicrobia bacterium LW23]|nr:hypothetical protein DB346_14065 [Verrucomicrobia bacterium LW23]